MPHSVKNTLYLQPFGPSLATQTCSGPTPPQARWLHSITVPITAVEAPREGLLVDSLRDAAEQADGGGHHGGTSMSAELPSMNATIVPSTNERMLADTIESRCAQSDWTLPRYREMLSPR